jgi:uncharacterized repeat protein (TIGR03837 family)
MRRWDIFCRVVDNFGDIGVCWRLARQLADEYSAEVRLWVDRLDQFAVLCPAVSPDIHRQCIGPIEVWSWTPDFPIVEPADVVIEAFACELPESYVAAMVRKTDPPVWINLEYLSAEAWIEGCHSLASSRPGTSLKKSFFFPGFTAKTGGLLRERGLLETRAAFDGAAATNFWTSLAVGPRTAGELRVSLFCYGNAGLPALLREWAAGPSFVRVFATAGAATGQVGKWLGSELAPGETRTDGCLTVHALPFLPPDQYDHLLWAGDINFVRGEDSFVRAQWAQQPFVWQIYPQREDAHVVKLDAFLARYLEGLPTGDVLRRFWHAWNGRGDVAAAWRGFVGQREIFRQHAQDWASQLDQMDDLANNLNRFVNGV